MPHILLFKRRDFIAYSGKHSESTKYGVEIRKIKNRRHATNLSRTVYVWKIMLKYKGERVMMSFPPKTQRIFNRESFS